MKSHDLSFLVLGAGAVGGITAALMKVKGYNVEVICKYDDYASLISGQGINVKGVRGNFTVQLPAYSSAVKLKEKKDVILHATKATDMTQAAMEAMPLLKDEGCFVSMQNGICEDELIRVAGNNRVIGCVTGWGATMESPGNLIMTSSGDFILGYPDREPDEFLNLVAEALSSVVPVRMTENIMGHLYSKLIINSCITSLGAICGLYLGKMLSMEKVRRIFIEIIRESVLVADSMKIRIETFGGKLDFKKFIAGTGPLADLKRHLMIRLIGFRYRRLKSSSLQSLERGKQSEIEYLNGYIVRNAEKYNIEVPVNKAVVRLIHEIEAKKREISVNNFSDPAFERFN
ncbi:MAG TPA: ketopantoate reductase family protein [Bacteroidales bacterium]|nr:2-dehydropantoate 2-reductase [Bacteroidales bacterium]HNR41394.1 ketopantoate reductase family protein [Bacteroidales bacterium]HPM17956.1 ketopantoate reductase family protein [Bacteroidales bacterium]HQG76214.1 ketopantoate reductase family protein [Bacteroidales bacterium]